MRSNNRITLSSVLIGALALGGCSSSGWWRDTPNALPPPPVADTGYGAAQPAYPEPSPQYPAGAEPAYPAQPDYSQTGAPYQPPQAKPERQPKHRAEAPVAVDTGYTPPPQMAVKYDNVGYAAWSAEPGTVAGAHPSLPPGSFVEVTSLDTGKTILVPITATSRPGREIELSGAAAQELGLGAAAGQAAVRVRTTNPTGGDIGALKSGRPAPARPDTPPVLLNALRRKLSGTQGQASAPYIPPAQAEPAPAPTRTVPPAARPPLSRPPLSHPPLGRPAYTAPTPQVVAATAGYYVQVAAIADAQRAQAIAREVGGAISTAGGLSRVRFGPFDDLGTAQAARDDIARRGYAEARIVRQD